MQIVIKVIIGLISFLGGWLLGNRNKKKAVRDAVKRTIEELNREHKKALEMFKKEYEEELRKKDEIIIEDLNRILGRLSIELSPYASDSSVESLIKKINNSMDSLNRA